MIPFPDAFLHKLYSRHNVFLWLCCNEKLKYFRLCSSHYSWFYEILVMLRISANMHAVDIFLSQFKSTAMFEHFSKNIFISFFSLKQWISWCFMMLIHSSEKFSVANDSQVEVYQNQFWCIWFYPFIQILNTKTVAYIFL